jgi:excisionase family DNA binding protein
LLASEPSSPTEKRDETSPSKSIEDEDEIPVKVADAAAYLGVSRQTVYSWVERKQIPHFRVMGSNIRFLKSDLEAFRAQFRQEVENGKAKQA